MNKVILLFLSLLISFSTQAEIVERVVAVVGADPILQSDFKILQEKSKKPLLLFDYLLPSDASLIAKADRKASLDYLIGEKIVESEIKRLGYVASSEKVEQEIRDIAKRNHVNVEEIYQSIRNEGVSVAEYQGAMKEQIERQSLLESEIISKIRISDDEALAEFIKSHPQSKLSVNEFTVSHIFFDPKKGGGEMALQRANAALKKLNAGESFETLAEQISEDPNFTSGGLLGTFKSGEFLREVEEAIAPLSSGQTTQVVKSRLGFHIVKVIGKKLTTDPQFERDKEQIKRRMLDQAIRRQFRIWLQSKKEDIFLRINE